jgi:hypothetical protein
VGVWRHSGLAEGSLLVIPCGASKDVAAVICHEKDLKVCPWYVRFNKEKVCVEVAILSARCASLF